MTHLQLKYKGKKKRIMPLVEYLDKGGATLNASHAFLLSLKYSSAACRAATAMP